MSRSSILAALAAGGLALVASAATAPAVSPGPKKVSIALRAKLANAHVVDAAPTGASPGDRYLFTEKLTDAKGRKAGSDFAECVQLFDKRSHCTGEYVLKRGQVMVQLVQPALTGNLDYRQAVTGGTGKYAGAGGTVLVKQRTTGDRFTFHLTIPR